MSYSKQTWDTTSYVNPTRMNHIEDGIKDISDDVEDLKEAVNKGSVSVTADGVKTWAELLNTLLSQIDTTKITSESKIVRQSGNNVYVFYLENNNPPALYYSSICIFSLTLSDAMVLSFRLQPSDSLFIQFTFPSTMNNVSTSVVGAGTTLTLYY